MLVREIVAVAVRTPSEHPGKRRQQVRKYNTFYQTLTEMVAWLVAVGITHVTMEATGIYWRPVFHALSAAEPPLEVLLVNARHVKNVPGRKTDVLDAAWLAELLEYGLLRGKFHPTAADRRDPRTDPLPQEAHRAAHQGAPATRQGARGRRHQDRLGRLSADHAVGPGHDRGADRRRARPARCWPNWHAAGCAPRSPT